MAVMGRKKQMVARLIENRRVAEADRMKMEEKQKDEISKEEHEKRLKLLREAGLIK